jgi:hypothetical protein
MAKFPAVPNYLYSTTHSFGNERGHELVWQCMPSSSFFFFLLLLLQNSQSLQAESSFLDAIASQTTISYEPVFQQFFEFFFSTFLRPGKNKVSESIS